MHSRAEPVLGTYNEYPISARGNFAPKSSDLNALSREFANIRFHREFLCSFFSRLFFPFAWAVNFSLCCERVCNISVVFTFLDVFFCRFTSRQRNACQGSTNIRNILTQKWEIDEIVKAEKYCKVIERYMFDKKKEFALFVTRNTKKCNGEIH